MTLRLEKRRSGRVTVVSVAGPGRLVEDPAVRVRLVDAVSESRFAVLDLTGLEQVEREDLGMLVSARMAHRLKWGNGPHGPKLVARTPGVLCRPVVVELDDVMRVYPSVDEALRAFPSRRVLHVEPDPESARSVAAILEGHGYDVFRVRAPEELPARSAAGDPELVLTEIEVDGQVDRDLVRRLRVEYGAPVAVVTRAPLRAIDGAAAVVGKPCSPAALLEAVERALESPVREYYEAILEGIGVPVLVANAGGAPRFANRAWRIRFGGEPDGLPDGLLAAVLEVAREGGTRRLELGGGAPLSLQGVRGTASGPDVLVVAEGAPDAAARPRCDARDSDVLLSLLEDLDGMARELERANRRLEELDELKSEFVATVSHELKTPVTSILGSVENLLDGLHGELVPDQQQALDVVRRNADRLARLILNLLDLSRIESGELALRRAQVDLREPVALACRQLESIRGHRDVRRTTDLPDQPVVGEVDPDRLVQVVTNLFDNALRFARGEARLQLTTDGQEAVLVVEDDGPGIPAGSLEAIFERFSGPRIASEGSHMGIGLSIVRGIVEAEGGRVWAENRAGGGGARFVARFPLSRSYSLEREAASR